MLPKTASDAIFSRVPEKYIGVISCQNYEEPRLERLKIFRGLRERHFDLVMKLDSSTKEYSEQKFVDPLLADLKNKMLTAVAQVNKWKRAIISQHDAELHLVFIRRQKKRRHSGECRLEKFQMNKPKALARNAAML